MVSRSPAFDEPGNNNRYEIYQAAIFIPMDVSIPALENGDQGKNNLSHF